MKTAVCKIKIITIEGAVSPISEIAPCFLYSWFSVFSFHCVHRNYPLFSKFANINTFDKLTIGDGFS